MGDPGFPIMLGLLAVPVGVLLFVVGLALMGGRWTTVAAGAPAGTDPLPLEAAPEPYGPPSYGWHGQDPYALPTPRPAPALPAASPERALPAAPPPARRDWAPYDPAAVRSQSPSEWASYGSPTPHREEPAGWAPYGGSAPHREEPAEWASYGGSAPRREHPSEWAPFMPPARRAPESSSYDHVDRHAQEDAAPSWHRAAEPRGYAAERDWPESDPRPFVEEPPRGFPYGPYGPR